jgi:SAM-dependent methyltransferase
MRRFSAFLHTFSGRIACWRRLPTRCGTEIIIRRKLRGPPLDAQKIKNCQTSYDLVADEYVRRIFDELQHKPLDRQLLDRFAASVRDFGPACDMGCGPGHVARYLHEQGIRVSGVDLSPEMVARARCLTPAVEFRQGDMLALDVADESWAGIAAFYSIIHIPRGDLPRALAELHRVLQPGGRLLVAFHIGDETVHLEEWWGHKVCVDFFFFRSDEIAQHLRKTGFEIEEIIERDPYAEVEHQSRRSYIFARRLAAES